MATTTTSNLGVHEKLNQGPSRIGTLVFGLVLILGLVFIGMNIARDLGDITLGDSMQCCDQAENRIIGKRIVDVLAVAPRGHETSTT